MSFRKLFQIFVLNDKVQAFFFWQATIMIVKIFWRRWMLEHDDYEVIK